MQVLGAMGPELPWAGEVLGGPLKVDAQGEGRIKWCALVPVILP